MDARLGRKRRRDDEGVEPVEMVAMRTNAWPLGTLARPLTWNTNRAWKTGSRMKPGEPVSQGCFSLHGRRSGGGVAETPPPGSGTAPPAVFILRSRTASSGPTEEKRVK